MSKIEFNCSACNSLLRVDQDHAGKKARCPKCNMIHDVPGTPVSHPGNVDSNSTDSRSAGPAGPTSGTSITGSSAPAPSTPAPSTPGPSTPVRQTPTSSAHSFDQPTHVQGGTWELQAADSQVYGPVDKAEMDEWAAEGRVSANCYLRQQGGQWFPAEQIYPQISGAPPTSPQPHYVGDDGAPGYGGTPGYGAPNQSGYPNPFSNQPAPQYQPTQFPAPYTQHYSNLRPHNGAMVLTMGILGLFFCCGITGIIAWIMGARDLSAMKAGTMDPSGHGIVMAGYVMGIISVLLYGGMFLLVCVVDGANF